MISLAKPYVDEQELAAVAEVLESGWYAHGPKNREFEQGFCELLGRGHAISLNSCASALFLALKAAGIQGEVILPSFTFVASANAVVAAGAIPVFADIKYDTCNIDPDAVADLVSPRTEAIMPVHFAGQCADMDPLLDLADRHGLLVVEDSAETLGSTYHGRQAGSMGVGCFSFFPTKNITTGEGGMLVTDDADLALKVRTWAGHGIQSSTADREKIERPWARAAVVPGFNMRMSNLLAAIGVVQLGKLEEMNRVRREHAAYLNEHLGAIPGVDVPEASDGCDHVYQMYTIKLRKGDRRAFIEGLKAKGISASVHFDPAVHQQPYYSEREDWPRGSLEVTERVVDSIVSLPMYPALERPELEQIVEAVRAGLRG